MKITKDEFKALHPCVSDWEWYCEKERPEDLLDLLLEINENSASNARWLFTKIATKEQNVMIAVFAAEQVIDIYESKYADDRPRKAIEAAKAWLADPSDSAAEAAEAAEAARERKELQKRIIRYAVKVLDGEA